MYAHGPTQDGLYSISRGTSTIKKPLVVGFMSSLLRFSVETERRRGLSLHAPLVGPTWNPTRNAVASQPEINMFEHVLSLSDALKTYYTDEELRRIAAHYAVEVPTDWRGDIDHPGLAEMLLIRMDTGRHKDFLAAIVGSLENRVDRAIADTDWEARSAHQSMGPRIRPLLEMVKEGVTRTEVTVRPSNPFTAKAEVRELITIAKTPITVVDNYVGLGTLDCLREASQPIRLLTGAHDAAIEKDFQRHLIEFTAEGRTIEVKRHGKLHDRYIILNDRCWLIGSSLKDAGKKAFTMIEMTDTHDIVMRDVEDKWKEAVRFFP